MLREVKTMSQKQLSAITGIDQSDISKIERGAANPSVQIMLCQFTFKNFRSYKEETVFDFQATSIGEFEDSLISINDNSPLLPVGVVYGPNGGGKTNLLLALSCLVSMVSQPINELGKSRQRGIIQERTNCLPYLLDDESRNEPTDFEVFFRVNGNEYRYNLSVLEEEIVRESLHWKTIGGKKTGAVFERNRSEIILGQSISKASINRTVNPKMPYLTFLAINYDIQVIAEVQRWFESVYTINFGNPSTEKTVFMPQEPSIHEKSIQALNDLGIDVNEFYFDNDRQRIVTQRTVKGKSYELFYEDESAGTRKLISVLPILLNALNEGRLVIVDELDAKLHPKLLRYIISLFKNKSINSKGAQLLFTSHDLSTMKNYIFRRDEIWFAYEKPEHGSEIYSLYEIRNEGNERIKATMAFDKQYLEGRYGADPYLSNMLSDGWK